MTAVRLPTRYPSRMSTLHLLLPPLARGIESPVLADWRRYGDRLPSTAPGRAAQLAVIARWDGVALPVAALTRETLHGDAGDGLWLCADPAWVQPDLTGVRLIRCGTLALDASEAAELAAPLRPLFGDQGLLLELSTPTRWHLRALPGTVLPDFAPPEAVLGADLLVHLPAGREARRWRALLTEAQVILHQHPRNAGRRAAGLPPVSSLWFWGGGALPAWVECACTQVVGEDPVLQALARRAGSGAMARPEVDTFDVHEGDAVGLDLADLAPDVLAPWLLRVDALLRRGRLTSLQVTGADGERVQVRRWHRWRFWRRAF